MVRANQRSIIDIHTKKKKESKYNTNDRHQVTRDKNKRRGRGMTYKNKFKTMNKMAIRTYRPIIILNISRLNVSTKKHRQTKWIQKQDLLPTKDSQI